MGGGGGGGGEGGTEPLCNIRTLRTMLCTKLISTVHCYHRSWRFTSIFQVLHLLDVTS